MDLDSLLKSIPHDLRNYCVFILLFAVIPTGLLFGQNLNLTKYVNPFIGTAPGGDKFGLYGNSGDVFPGADYPRGMLQWSPDTPTHIPGGYFYPDSIIKGFSIRHFSGRGCVALQDVSFMPFVGNINAPPSKDNEFYEAPFSHKNESASPGYYQVQLGNGIKIQLTVTRRTGLGKFIFPKTKNAVLIINGSSSARGNTKHTKIFIVGNNQIEGYATAKVGCGEELYTIYYVARFNEPFETTATWNGDSISKDSRSSEGEKVGAFLTFDAHRNNTIEAKIAVSFVSIKNAEKNLIAEDSGWNFENIRASVNSAWNKVLNKIAIYGGSIDKRKVFYTALYHCYFHPNIFSDVNGKYIGMDGKIHRTVRGRIQYENIPGWDNYRSASALISILSPDEEGDIVQSLVNDAKQGGGGLPRWEQANRNSGGMVGDGPVIIIANAYAFGVSNFDTEIALHAMSLDAGKVGTTSDSNLVRIGLSDYINQGYVPGSASITLEYASADFALSQYAKSLGDTSNYKHFLEQAENWKNLFNTSTGFIQPRDSSGTWVANITAGSNIGYTEGSAAQYTWLVPFDFKELFKLMGSRSKAISRLDNYFTKLNDGPTSQYAFMGNEPCEGDPWIYDFAGAPYKTQAVVRRIQAKLFKDTPNGFPGNDDAGALSSWYVFSALGIYPEIPGVNILVLGSPVFHKAVIHLKNGDVTIIGKDANSNFSYIHSLSVNGKDWNRTWIRFNEISNGGKIIFGLSSIPDTSWGSCKNDAPPYDPKIN
jgi:predicted alpha-1,2-mannosidase